MKCVQMTNRMHLDCDYYDTDAQLKTREKSTPPHYKRAI